MDVAFERRVMRFYETACDWPAASRDSLLAEALADDPETLGAVRAMLRADTAFLPTVPPDPSDHAGGDGPVPELIGRYRIVGEIGRGGMGVVYRGERADGAFDQRVAIKLIRGALFSQGALDRFELERRLLARLHHPHIAQLLDGGVSEDGGSYIVMELIDGRPITDHADAQGLPLPERLNLFLQACDAVECAHRNLVVHADIKPSNVVVAESFGVKLLDFGIARLLGEGAEDGVSPHTPGYASPAQASGMAVTPADDVFGLGALLQALIEGVPGVDPDLAAIVGKAMAEDPARRYGAVSELADDIGRWQRHEPVSSRPADRKHRAVLLWKRNKIALSAAAVVLALLIGTAVITTILYLQANAARAAAERRFEETRSLSRYLIDDVTRALAPLPGSGPIRQRIALRANAALEQLSRVPGASVELQADSAKGYSRVGEILAVSDLRYQADPQAGHVALVHAETTLRRLTAAMPERADLVIALVQAMVADARFLSIRSNDPKGALRVLDAAAARLAGLSAVARAGTDAENAGWDLELARATIYDTQGMFEAEQELLPPVIARYSALRLPRTAERALRIDSGWTMLADAQYYKGEIDAALVSYRHALEALLPPAFASDARIVTRQGYTAYNVAAVLAEQKRFDDALKVIRLGDAAMDRLLNFDKGAPSLHMQAIVKLEYATELVAVKRFDEGIAQARASIDERIGQARLQPASYEALRSVPVGLRPLAEMYRAAGREPEACATAARADAAWDAIARRMTLSRFDAGDERAIVKKLRLGCPA